ncbi:uncharacterized protein LOC107417682 isoform X1 [Ziziphus jujuba]|uniref:Uncharacterized protein LOC107417682 isoform X1 n=2 Tax=Ziziphus jujuba TaxID=326968 RepID=A0ABM3ZX82_ZIZJJ|nr:uncharacterized protein LOC107417682 isoform X1 [Ziziphus jujuba]
MSLLVNFSLTSKTHSYFLISYIHKQGCHARNRPLFFDFSMKGFAFEWYFHHSVGRTVVCYLPTNLFDDNEWVGFGLYARFTRNNLSHLETTPPLLYIDLHTHGSSISHVKTFLLHVHSFPHHFLVFHARRLNFGEELNQCWGVSALFRTSTPDVEVKMCGIRVVYEEDLASVVDMVTEIELNRVADDEHSQQRCYQSYSELMEQFLNSVESDKEQVLNSVKSDEAETRKEEMPNIHYGAFSSESEYESLRMNKFLSSIQPIDEYVSAAAYEKSVPSESFVAHSKTFFESTYQGINANRAGTSSSRDSEKGLIHLQIMAESHLHENDWLTWKNNLEDFLQTSYNVIITLSIKGHIISLVKPFHPFLPYNICFPVKETPEWFKGWKANMRRLAVKLPPNLNVDNNWRGVAICASFSVYGNPYAISNSDNDFFRLLCHLRTNIRHCLNPAPMFRITKDKFKWLFVHGFIWLTYIPSCLLLAELNGQDSEIFVEIFNECPGLLTQGLAVRLLYEQDVEEFRKSIIKCTTSFFDNNLDLIHQFVDNENEIPSSEISYFFKQPTYPYGLDFDRDTLMLSCCPPTEILEWFTHHTSGPSVTIQLPPYLCRDATWIGLALCAYFSDLEHTSEFDPEIPHYLTCHLETDRVRLDPLHKNFNMLRDVEFMWLSFIPHIWFGDQLNNCNLIEASFASERGGWGAHKCGLRLIYLHDEEEFKQIINHCMASTYDDPDGHDGQEGCSKSSSSIIHDPQQTNRSNEIHVELLQCGPPVTINKDVPKFSQDLDDTSSTKHPDLTSVEHYLHLLEKESELERSSDVKVLESHHPPVTHSLRSAHRPTNQLRRDLEALFSRVFFEGSSYARNIPIPFSFPSTEFAFSWFFHQSVGRFVVCYLPANLLDDKSWVGFSLYAALRLCPSDLHSNHLDSGSPLLLHIDFHSHGSSISHIKTISDLPILRYSHQTILFSAPRVYFKQDQLNQCWGVSALFRTSSPNLEVETCGIRAVYDQDMGTVNEMIAECQLSFPNEDQECYQAYEFLMQGIITAHQSVKPMTRNEEIPIHSSHSSKRDYESNMFLSSTQPVDKEISSAYKELSIPLDPVVVHSKPQYSESSSYKLFSESTSRDSKLGIIHLQIMAESSLFENDFVRWKNNLDNFLQRHSSFFIIITLSLKGQIISVFKPFETCSTYNLCFPRKEILEWFTDYQVSRRTFIVKLPPNLKNDKNWLGIAVCVAFSVNEHPNLILDEELEVSFRVLCHMHTDQGWCLDLAPVFPVTKDNFKWSCVGGFIWLTYIPSSLLLPELKGQSYIVIDIYSECPGVLTKNLGVRLLYQQDVEEFKQSLSKCLTGFLDNLDTISKFMGDGNEKNPCRADELGSSSKNSKGCVVTQPENVTAEPTFPGKTGMAFDLDMIYNSCFSRTEILDWFIHHGNGPSAEIQLPSNLYDGDWIGVALCAYFTYDEHPSTFIDNFDPEIPQFLICNFGLDTLHLYQMTNEAKKIDGEFIWLSYIPRLWFSDQWKDSSLVEASFASDIGGLRAQKCGLRLLYRHDEEEFKRTISYCMASMIENKDPVSHVKADNEGKKKVLDDGHDPQHERVEGADNANPMDKGKQVTE